MGTPLPGAFKKLGGGPRLLSLTGIASGDLKMPHGCPIVFPGCDGEITVLLAKWRDGEPSAFEELMPLVYPHLRRWPRGMCAGR
jgi:hypothetical protein